MCPLPICIPDDDLELCSESGFKQYKERLRKCSKEVCYVQHHELFAKVQHISGAAKNLLFTDVYNGVELNVKGR